MDDVKRLELLASVLREYDLDAIRVRIGESEIEVVRRSSVPVAAMPAAPSPPAASQPLADAAPVASSTTKKVGAPLVGVFYRSAAPGDEPFVEVGDRVDAGDTLCTLEAMKIFNEITSDFSGVVTRIVPENGELVAVGDDLFWIETA